MKKVILLVLIHFFLVDYSYSQTKREIQKLKKEYSKIKKPEISFQDYIKYKQRGQVNKNRLTTGKTKRYGLRSVSLIDDSELCGIGGFENVTDLNTYFEGGYDDSPNFPLNYDNFTQGISTVTGIGQSTSRQTIVSNMDDPTIQETLNTARSGNNALRLGNSVNGHGVEFLSVDINVSSPIISFWYAMVLHDPSVNHLPQEIPFFEVRVLDSNGNEINNVVNLGGNSNRIPSTDPFVLQATFEPNVNIGWANQIRYKPWSCAQIDLSNNIGENVTIQFINSDCSQGGHISYTYIDDIECSGCTGDNPTGNISFNSGETDCEENKICFDYLLPDNGINTGTIQINLEVRGENNTSQNYDSGIISSGNSFCFTIPSNDVNTFGGGYDFVAEADFTLNGLNVNTLNSGAWSDGQIAGSLNDCENKIVDFNFDPCCPPINKKMLDTLFTPNFTPGLSGNYTVQFSPIPEFINQMQAYVNYLNAINPSVDGLYFTWRLMDMGTGNTAATNYWGLGQIGGDHFMHFVPNGSGIVGNTNFFTDELNSEHWHKIHVGMYLNNGIELFNGAACSTSTIFRWQLNGATLRKRDFNPKTKKITTTTIPLRKVNRKKK